MTAQDPHEHRHATEELRKFREEAEALGFSDPESLDADLESSDQFIARMKARDAAITVAPVKRLSPGRRLTVLAVGVAAASAVIAGFITQSSSPARAEGPPILNYEFASAVRIAYAGGEEPGKYLDLLAEAANAASAPPKIGSIQYKQTDNWFSEQTEGESAKIVPRVSQTWLSPDGSWTTSEALGTPLRSDGRGIESGDTGSARESNDRLPAGSVDADFAASLPTEPEKLRTALLNSSGCESRRRGPIRSMCLYGEIVNLFRTYVVPPKLAAGLWQMLDGEAGFESLGSVEDRAGREGIGISIIDPDRPEFRFILIGSLEDGQLLGSEDILIRRVADVNIDPPSVYAFTAILSSKYTNAVPSLD